MAAPVGNGLIDVGLYTVAMDAAAARSLAAAALVTTLVVGGGLFQQPGGMLGYAGAEMWGHAWVQWWHGEALPAWPRGTSLAVGAERWPVIDPLWTLLLAALGRVVGVVTAWNIGQLAAVVVAFLGGSALARREGGEPLIGGLALALAPAFMGSLASGLTEDAMVGLAAAGLGLVGRPGWRTGVLAGLALGLLAGCGLLLAWQVAVVAVAFSLVAVTRDRRTLPSTLVAGGIALVLALPVALSQGSRLAGEGHRLGVAATRVEPLWRLNPWRGVDLASLLVPGPQDPGEALVRIHPGYLGWSLLGLAMIGGRSRWWWVLLGAVLVAPGDALSFAGRPLELGNPAARLLDLLPGGSLVNHHGRLLLVGAIALSVLAARGAARLRARWGPRAVLGVTVLVAIDLVLLAPGGAPLPVADPTPPDVLTRLEGLPTGPMIVLPAGGPGVHFQRPLFDQRVHRRPLLINPTRPGLPAPLDRTPTGRWLAGLGAGAAPPPGELDFGPAALLFVAPPLVEPAADVLGPPTRRGRDGAVWDLAAARRAKLRR
ncbi:MAG: hypothetical protein D6798_02560 [Deltaproteobacteria bacterium]|nr:MAG: hypothetical protein D6798_02560 [Deltaproteobacteria bacterium]